MHLNKTFHRMSEWLIEKAIAVCGALTSIVILLIIIFLFKEGSGLFNAPSIEAGYTLLLNAENKVDHLSVMQLKQIFDGEIVNWQEVGGADTEITIYRLEDETTDINQLIAATPGIIVLSPDALATHIGASVRRLPSDTYRLSDFFASTQWIPTATPSPLFGILPLVAGTLLISIVAILIALPLGLGVAIYLSELADERTRRFLKPAIELLAGIPSVVYGFFGLVVLVPFVQQTFNLPVGETAFTGSVILAIMALPTIITVAEDALHSTPQAMREASLALGGNQWQTIYRVVIPYAASGISAAIVLGIGRAVGETMAVLMVTGNAAVIPHSLFQSVRTIPATIAAELGEAPAGGIHYRALFMLGALLFLITLVISITAEVISKRKHQQSLL